MGNVILLPETIKQLKKHVEEALQHQQFEAACTSLQTLIDCEVGTHEDYLNFLSCLMKLKRLEEAEKYCGQALDQYDKEDNRFFEIYEFYMMILFQMNDFVQVRSLIEEISEGNIPTDFQERYQALYQICYEQSELRGRTIFDQFDQAVKEEDYKKQIHLLLKWQALKIDPDEDMSLYVEHSKVHPYIKTNILTTLVENHYALPIKVEKFSHFKTVQPNQLLGVREEMGYDILLSSMEAIEQNNPTLYNIIQELINQYCTIMYPFTVDEKNVASLKKAFLITGKEYLALDISEHEVDATIRVLMENIRICGQLYAMV